MWLVGVREREKGVAAGWSEEAAAVMGLGWSPAAPAQPSSEGSWVGSGDGGSRVDHIAGFVWRWDKGPDL